MYPGEEAPPRTPLQARGRVAVLSIHDSVSLDFYPFLLLARGEYSALVALSQNLCSFDTTVTNERVVQKRQLRVRERAIAHTQTLPLP